MAFFVCPAGDQTQPDDVAGIGHVVRTLANLRRRTGVDRQWGQMARWREPVDWSWQCGSSQRSGHKPVLRQPRQNLSERPDRHQAASGYALGGLVAAIHI